MARETTDAIVKALKDAIHVESAFLAPRTSTLIEMAKLAIEEIERQQEYKRLQMVDIITLGQQVGKLESEVKRLEAALLDLYDHPESYSQATFDLCESIAARKSPV